MSGFSYPVGTRYKYLPVEMSWDIFRHRHVAKTNVLSHPTANLNQSPDSLFSHFQARSNCSTKNWTTPPKATRSASTTSSPTAASAGRSSPASHYNWPSSSRASTPSSSTRGSFSRRPECPRSTCNTPCLWQASSTSWHSPSSCRSPRTSVARRPWPGRYFSSPWTSSA